MVMRRLDKVICKAVVYKNKALNALVKPMRADGHLVAVLLVIAAVCGACAIFNSELAVWFTDNFSAYRTQTQQIYSNM